VYISFFELVPALKDYFLREKPKSILIISESPKKHTTFIKDIMNLIDINVKVDKIVVNDDFTQDIPNQTIYPMEYLVDKNYLSYYDCILITDVFETVTQDTTLIILNKLLKFTFKSILVVTPMLTSNPDDPSGLPMRISHPTLFSSFDFSFVSILTTYGYIQLYAFFPQKERKPYKLITIEHFIVNTKKLKIGYVLPHKNLTGGLKCLLEQMRQLHRKGHTVYAIYKGLKDDCAIPSWSNIDIDKDISGQIILSNDTDIKTLSNKVDVIMLGFINQIPEFSNLKIPTVYWEQGYEQLYGDYGSLLDSNCVILKNFRTIYNMPVHFLSVSDIVSQTLYSKYGIESKLLYNGIDLNFYKPLDNKPFSSTIIIVGSPILQFKNFEFALNALNEVWAQGFKFNVKWACQVQPSISGVNFPIEYYVMPSQSELAELYRYSDIFLSTSVYESFPMPPIEAMASGTPVISTDSGGIHTYGRAGENLLLVDQGDINSCASAIIYLLQSESARLKLKENGLKTAQHFNFDRIVMNLENYFYSLVEDKKEKRKND
jgi:glycosyltransferase involved in cell wall biosynthesis